MESTGYDFSYSLGYQTIISGRLFASVMTRRLGQAGLDITSEQWAVLRILRNKGAQSQSALLAFVRTEKSSLSRLLDGLESRELIRREAGRDDARRKYAHLTPKGAMTAEQGTKIAMQILKRVYQGIDGRDLQICRNVLEKAQEALLRLGGEAT